MSRMLQIVTDEYQWVSDSVGASTRHPRNMI
jgi:hypothetical protein